MIIIDEMNYSLQNLRKRFLRSFLTVLSILIGIAAIFSLVSFGLGIDNYVKTLAEEAGTNKLYIMAKGSGAPGTDDTFFISKDEVDFVEKIRGVDRIVPFYNKVVMIESDEQQRYYFVAGLDPDDMDFFDEISGVKVNKGRQLKKGDMTKVVLGYNYQFDDKVFKKKLKLGDKVLINSRQFEIIGFYEEVGNPNDDANIYTLPEVIEELYPEVKDKYAAVFLSSDKTVTPKDLADKITERLRKFKGQDEGKEDFFVQTFEDALKTFGTVIVVINGVLFLVALISVIVASVNIMNTMYTAVIERTKEIGVMKAIGAKNSSILFIFIFESGFLGLSGGAIGVVLGYIIAKIGESFAAAAGYSLLKPIFPYYLTVSCLLFAFAVGSLAGLWPARHAARLKPVEALRYE